ncbi:hypothetical protein D8I24_6547 [Cupriavidus necator H850]|nr:hypothetical protein D8I24_6547 [Cupriavidus necator H850]
MSSVDDGAWLFEQGMALQLEGVVASAPAARTPVAARRTG